MQYINARHDDGLDNDFIEEEWQFVNEDEDDEIDEPAHKPHFFIPDDEDDDSDTDEEEWQDSDDDETDEKDEPEYEEDFEAEDYTDDE